MSTYEFSVPFGSVDLEKLRSDEDFSKEARRFVPDVLTRIGEKTAENAWSQLQKSFRTIPGFKANSSSSDKARFIREAGQNYKRKASSQDRREIESYIVDQLRQMKRRAG